MQFFLRMPSALQGNLSTLTTEKDLPQTPPLEIKTSVQSLGYTRDLQERTQSFSELFPTKFAFSSTDLKYFTSA